MGRGHQRAPAWGVLRGEARLCAHAGAEEWLHHQFLVDLGGGELWASELFSGEGGDSGPDADGGARYGEVWGARQCHLAGG